MAVYPEGNPGVVPIDPETAVGRFRILSGDTSFVKYNPDEAGYGNFTYFSDAEIEGYLAIYPESLSRAIGNAYLTLASSAAIHSQSIKDYDLAVDTTKRSADLRAIAQMWFDRADDEDAASGGADIFDTFDMSGDGGWIPEATPPVWGRSYTWRQYN